MIKYIHNILSICSIVLCMILTSCNQNPQIPSNTPEVDTVKTNLLEYNKLCMEDERREIEAYADSIGGFTKSEEGFYYKVDSGQWTVDNGYTNRESLSTVNSQLSTIKDGDLVAVAYSIELLDGTICYQSTDGKALTFTVGKRQVIKGLDIAIVGHCIGDEIEFIFPYNMAYGIAGDRECITPMTPVLYRIKIISVE